MSKDRVVETFCPVDFAPLNYENARARLEASAGEDGAAVVPQWLVSPGGCAAGPSPW